MATLPEHVFEAHGALYFLDPAQPPVHIGPASDVAGMYRWLADRVSAPAAAPAKVYTMNDAFDRYDREVIPELSPNTQAEYRRYLKVLRAEFGHRRPDDIEPRDIGRFLDVASAKVLQNKRVAVLSAVFGKLVGRWYEATRNPCAKVERNPEYPRDRLVTDAEFDAVHALAPVRVQLMMELALLTGQRQGDLLSLRWSQVTDDGIAFRQAKTGKRLMVMLSPALRDVLERAKKLKPDLPREFVIRTFEGRGYTPLGFRANWQRVMDKYMKSGGERFRFHDIRAKSASDSDSLEHAYERLGHTSIAMTRKVYDRGCRKVAPLR